MKFKLVDLNKKKKPHRDDMKYTQVLLTRASQDTNFFNIRLARNLSQCLHVDFSEKKKKQEESAENSDGDDDGKGFTMGMFQAGGGAGNGEAGAGDTADVKKKKDECD